MQVQFEAGLRTVEDKALLDREKKWSNIPKKDKSTYPEFIPKYQDEIQIRKEMKETGKEKKLTYTG
jgi:hypothetical protein